MKLFNTSQLDIFVIWLLKWRPDCIVFEGWRTIKLMMLHVCAGIYILRVPRPDLHHTRNKTPTKRKWYYLVEEAVRKIIEPRPRTSLTATLLYHASVWCCWVRHVFHFLRIVVSYGGDLGFACAVWVERGDLTKGEDPNHQCASPHDASNVSHKRDNRRFSFKSAVRVNGKYALR